MRYSEETMADSEACWTIVESMLADGLTYEDINTHYLHYGDHKHIRTALNVRGGLPIYKRERIMLYQTPADPRLHPEPTPEPVTEAISQEPATEVDLTTLAAWPERYRDNMLNAYPTDSMVRVVRFMDCINTFAALVFMLDAAHLDVLVNQLNRVGSTQDDKTRAFYEAAMLFALEQQHEEGDAS